MTDYGVNVTGFRRKTQAEILAAIGAKQRAKIAPTLATDDSKTVLGNLNQIVSDELGQAWEAAEAGYNAFDPDNALDYALQALCALSGVTIQPAGPGSALCSVGVAAGASFAAGTMVAHVLGQTVNEWTNAEDVASAMATTLTGVRFVSTLTGPTAAAPAGSLTVIAQPLAGWFTITNPADADPGTAAETVEALRIRRDESLAASGSGTLPAVVAAVDALDGVLSIKGLENVQDFPALGLPAHSIRVCVYAPAVSDDLIAQTIYDTKGGGVRTYGANTGAIRDVNGDPGTESFLRAQELHPTVQVTVISASGYDATAAKDAIILAQSSKGIGVDVLLARISAAVLTVSGVDNVTAVSVNFIGADFVVTDTQIAIIAPGDITFS